jgi:hypothetical protein
MTNEANTGALYYTEGMGLGSVLINDHLNMLGVFSGGVIIVEDDTINDEDSVTPGDGKVWWIPSAPAAGDAWEGHATDFAASYGGGYVFIETREGQLMYVKVDKKLKLRSSSGTWQTVYTGT